MENPVWEQARQFTAATGMDVDFTFFFIAGGLIATRILVAINLTPYLGVRPVPGNIRVSTALALTFFVYPLVIPGIDKSQIPQGAFLLIALFLKEAMFGMLLGLVNMMIFYGIQSAGNMVDNQRYVANARIFNPALGSQASLFGVFFFQLTLALFLVLGGHRFFIKALVESFQTIPLLTFPKIEPGITPMVDFMIRLTGDTLIICLQLSMPVLIAIFIADLILGLTNRIAPMINVFEMGFNIKGFVGVALVYLSLPVFIYQTKYWFQYLIQAFSRVTQYFVK